MCLSTLPLSPSALRFFNSKCCSALMRRRFKDLLKLHREAEDRLKAVEDVGVRVARAALDTLIVSCERWSTR
jgi:hypothetical protein